MARFDGGWVKLHRSIITSAIGKDGTACWIFVVLVSWANTEETRILGKPLKRGELVTGIYELAEQTGFHPSTVSRKLKLLEEQQMIVRCKQHRGSKITILNYSKFQDTREFHEGSRATQLQPSCNSPATQLQPSCNLNEEYNNIRTKEYKKGEAPLENEKLAYRIKNKILKEYVKNSDDNASEARAFYNLGPKIAGMIKERWPTWVNLSNSIHAEIQSGKFPIFEQILIKHLKAYLPEKGYLHEISPEMPEMVSDPTPHEIHQA